MKIFGLLEIRWKKYYKELTLEILTIWGRNLLGINYEHRVSFSIEFLFIFKVELC